MSAQVPENGVCSNTFERSFLFICSLVVLFKKLIIKYYTVKVCVYYKDFIYITIDFNEWIEIEYYPKVQVVPVIIRVAWNSFL